MSSKAAGETGGVLTNPAPPVAKFPRVLYSPTRFGIILSKAAEISVAFGKEQKKEAGEMKKVWSLVLAVCLVFGCFACQNQQEEVYSSALAGA